MWVKFVLILVLCSKLNAGEKILGIFHNPSKSHFHLGNTLLQALAERGHEVTFITPIPVKTNLKNYKIVLIDGLQTTKDEFVVNVISAKEITFMDRYFSLRENYQRINLKFFKHPKVQQLMNSNTTYDLVILDWIFNDYFLGFAHHFDASSIIFSSFGSSSLINRISGNSAPSSYVPNIMPTTSDEMPFVSRFLNTAGVICYEIVQFFDLPRQDKFLHTYFPTAPHIKTLFKNVSLVFVNNHFTIETPRPYVPNMVQIGGFHIVEPNNSLSGELKNFMDGATEGVLYFSLGSLIKRAQLDDAKVQLLINAFAKIPMKVLWKFDDYLQDIPPNVRIEKWLPQTEILAHPNTKIFVTQCGILSLSEALYFGIPVIGLPFLGDQQSNLEVGVTKGYALRLDFRTLTEEALVNTVMKMSNDPRYGLKAKQRSEWFRDQPIKPLDKAIYWVEYVMRHKGAHHLKVQGIKLPWYQYFLLDVILAMLTIVTFIMAISFITLKFFKNRLTNLAIKNFKTKGD